MNIMRKTPTNYIRSSALALWLVTAMIPASGRPLDTDDTGTAARGTWELEGGVDFVRADGAESLALTPVLAYGLTETLQLDIGCDYLLEMGAGGGTDLHGLRPALQLKSRFWEAESSGISLGGKANFGRHVYVRGPHLDSENAGHLRLLLTKAVGATEFDFNAGYDFIEDWGDGDDAWVAAAGVRRTINSTLVLMAEIFCTMPEQGGRASTMIAVGAKLAVRNDWTLDALVGTGLNSSGPDFRLVLGFVRAL